MIETVARTDAEALVRKTLCSCFPAVDGTITVRWDMVSGAARAIASLLRSHGLVDRDLRSVEETICGILRPDGEKTIPVSVPATVVARRICSAMRTRQLAA